MTKESEPDWKVRWGKPGLGKFFKRMLAKARRRYIKEQLRGQKPKSIADIESEVNNKTH